MEQLTISKLIEVLEKIRKEHGDLEVYNTNDYGEVQGSYKVSITELTDCSKMVKGVVID